MTTGIRVLVIEDDLDLRESVVEYLQLAGYAAAGVGNALECYRILGTEAFSVVVVDIGLPDQSGYVLVEYLRKNFPLGIIVLTARSAVEDRVQGYQAGADIYMVKPVDARELAAAIFRLGERLQQSTAAAAPPASNSWRLLRDGWRLEAPAGGVIQLTGKEEQFLSCLARTPGTPVGRAVILAALGYSDDEFSKRALDSMVRRLRRKIEEVGQCPAPIRTIHGVGYSFSAPVTIC